MRAPKSHPCGSCPYRQDVPSGIWHADEYAKLIRYDRPLIEQPLGVFGCHQSDDTMCSGWVGTHDMEENFALRNAVIAGHVSVEDYEAALDYESPVPLFSSGMEAAVHGMKEISSPGARADAMRRNLIRKGKAQ